MPQATVKSAAGVKIEISDPKRSFRPGDQVSGYAVWRSPSIGFVRVRLFGRIKTKIERKQATRGRAMLFDVNEVLHSGNICTNGEQAQPFSLTIPTTIQSKVMAGGDSFKVGIKDEWRESADFLSGADNNGDLPLPFSYYYLAASMGVKAEGFVEYVLQVETNVDEQAAMNDVTTDITSVPLTIGIPPTPRTNHTRQLTRSWPATIVALSADADFDKTQLTFRQKMKKTFRQKSLPRYSFFVRVDAPAQIQLDDERPFPFRVCIYPVLDPERTNLDHGGDVLKLPPVRIIALKLYLRSTTIVRCPASWMDDESDKFHNYEWEISDVDMVLPVDGICESSGMSSRGKAPADSVDLGDALKLRLTPLSTVTRGASSKPFPRPVWPSFKTFSINVSYDLMFVLTLECLGERTTIGNENYAKSRVIILPPEQSRHGVMKTKREEFDAVGLVMDVENLAWNIASNFLF